MRLVLGLRVSGHHLPFLGPGLDELFLTLMTRPRFAARANARIESRSLIISLRQERRCNDVRRLVSA